MASAFQREGTKQIPLLISPSDGAAHTDIEFIPHPGRGWGGVGLLPQEVIGPGKPGHVRWEEEN